MDFSRICGCRPGRFVTIHDVMESWIRSSRSKPARGNATGWNAGGWRARGRSVSMRYGTGGLLVSLSLLWKPPPAVDRSGILAIGLTAMAVPFVVLALGRRFTMVLSHVATAFGAF